ncbi:hypothetical protein T484DRAFT_1855024 [Baffinella frigidus]|nr:hypothetical protein T484DRAFT_1855024 [Cryptophyta sp. CCMP2293]
MADTLSVASTHRPDPHRPDPHANPDDNNGDDHSDDEQTIDLPPGMIYSENGAPAFEKTDSAALDLFTNCVPGIEPQKLRQLLDAAWIESPLTALQLCFQTGSVRVGKMDRNNFYLCMQWLWDIAPATLVCNIHAVPQITCLKDVLEILVFVLHGRTAGDPLSLDNSIQETDAARDRKRTRLMTKPSSDKKIQRTARRTRRIALKQAFALSINKPLSEILLPTDGDADMADTSNQMADTSNQMADTSNQMADTSNQMADTSNQMADTSNQMADTSNQMADTSNQMADADAVTQSPYKVVWVSQEIKGLWDKFVLAHEAETVLAAKAAKQARILAMKTDGNPSPGHIQELFDAVVEIFVNGLTDELNTFRTNPVGLGGLYAKWAPSVGGRHDKAVPLLLDTIAKKVLVGELYQDTWATLSEEDATHTRRVAYSSKVLSTLRGAASIPEHYTGSGDWHSVSYDKMPSRCRLLFGEKTFLKHDEIRYMGFLKEAEAKALAKKAGDFMKGPSVKTGALLPHEITEQGFKTFKHLQTMQAMVDANEQVSPNALELAQAKNTEMDLCWDGLVDGVKTAMAKGKGVGRCIPVIDVSGSMNGIPIEVATALGLLLACASPESSGFFGKAITFDDVPELVTVVTPWDLLTEDGQPKLLGVGQAVANVRKMGWGGSTDLLKTLRMYLFVSLQNETPISELQDNTLVILSDMEFDDVERSTPWQTTHEAAVAMFSDVAIPMPKIVYWNLRAKQDA